MKQQDGEQPGVRLDVLADCAGAVVVGDGSVEVRGIATLDRATPEQLSFLTNTKYRAQAAESRAAALIVGKGFKDESRPLLVSDEPYLAVARILAYFHPDQVRPRTVSDRASVDPSAVLGERVRIEAFAVIEADARLADDVTVGAHCVVGEGSRIGAASSLRPGVVLYPQTSIGEHCLIHSGVVLGADGFGFATSGGVHHKVPQVGRAVLEDHVELGANTTVDRGALEDTRIGAGSKIDDQVMVAHGVHIGRGSLLAAQSGVAGSTQLGAFTILAGQAGVGGHLRIADGTVVTAKAAVLSDVPSGGMISGYPAWEHAGWKRSQAAAKRLPEMRKQLRDLRERVQQLETVIRDKLGEA